MSLNGLDNPEVRQAHETAAAEPGGWFLLKYASRDEIELLGRGNGGIVEIRNAIAQFEESAPLYGFLRYRRRNVVIKYLPEECSRLVQARVSVHFNSVSERFSPYDTIFEIAAAKELKDTKLSAACSLHAASGSTSSSTSSLRRRRLMEIAEEEEEEQRASKRQSIVQEDSPAPTERPRSALVAAVVSASSSTLAGVQSPLTPTVLSPSSPPPPVTLNSELAASPEESRFAGTSEPPSFLGVPRPPSPARSFDTANRRMSSQSTRPDFYSYASHASAYGKPKVKLGPRPSVDLNGRPRTAGNYRPVSSIPAGFKLFAKNNNTSTNARKGKAGKGGPESIDEHFAGDEAPADMAAFLTATIPIPEVPQDDAAELKRPHTAGGRPTTSSGVSIKVTMAPQQPVANGTLAAAPPAPVAAVLAATRQKAMTPEKARLLKAMQLRDRKKKLSMLPPAPPIEIIEPSPEEEEEKTAVAAEVEVEAKAEEIPAGVALDASARADSDVESHLSMSKADSGVEMEAASPPTPDGGREESKDDAVSEVDTDGGESHPASPLAPASEVDDSTQASSLSESTDETIHAMQQMKEEDDSEDANAEPEPEPVAAVAHAPVEDAGEAVQHAAEPAAELEREPEPDSSSLLPPKDESEARGDEFEAENVPSSPTKVAVPVSKFAVSIPAPIPTSPEPEPAKHQDAADVDASEEAPKSPQWKVPVSKFAAQEPPRSPTKAVVEQQAVPAIVETTSEPAPEPEEEHEAKAKAEADEPKAEESRVEDVSETASSKDIVDARSETDRSSIDTKRSKRKALIEPIKTDLDLPEKHRGESEGARSDANLSDDDDLMEELRSATVHEAKHMTVSKSPITPVFPSPSRHSSSQLQLQLQEVPVPPMPSPNNNNNNNNSGESKSPSGTSTPQHVVRTTSNPVRGTLLIPGDVTQSSARSVSSGAAFLHKITQQQSSANLAPKPGKLGSSISQRIKALEKLSSSGGGGPANGTTTTESPARNVTTAAANPPPTSSSAFFSVRKSSVREPSRSPSVADRAHSIKRHGQTPSPQQSRESSPEAAKAPVVSPRGRSASVASRLSIFETGGSGGNNNNGSGGGNANVASSTSAGRGRPESIQVTARIVRDPSQTFPRVPEHRAAKDPADFGALDLKQSPLVVDHQRAEPAATANDSAATDLGRRLSSQQAADERPRETIQERRLSRDKRKSRDSSVVSASREQNNITSSNGTGNQHNPSASAPAPKPRRSSLSIVKDFIKERRNSIVGGSTDNNNTSTTINNTNTNTNTNTNNTNNSAFTTSAAGFLSSPALPTPSSRSPSRPPSTHQNNSSSGGGFPRRLSISSRRSSMSRETLAGGGGAASSPFTFPDSNASGTGNDSGGYADESSSRSNTAGSAGSVNGDAASSASAKKSRASRFIRRLSSSIGGGRKNMTPTISPTVAEEDDTAASFGFAAGGNSGRPSPPNSATAVAAYLGDVNVQFPDNLLWKRRGMSLDAQGFLILSPVQGPAASAVSSPASLGGGMAGSGSSSRNGGVAGAASVKRFHISEFRLPYTPEMEVQELPNSVVLDFVDGSGLQIACEDRAGQLNVLQTLQDCHRSHASFGQ